MSLFRYKAIDASGNAVTGELISPSLEELKADLESKGFRVESIELCEDTGTQNESSRAQAKLSSGQLHELGEHIVDLTTAELPLSEGLNALIQEMPAGRFRRTLKQVVQQLATGDKIENVLASHGSPSDFRNLVQVGLRTGRIPEVLGHYLVLARNATELRRRIMLGLGYSAVLIAAAIGVVLFLLCWIVPDFTDIFEDFNTELPGLSLLLIGISNLIVNYGLWVVFAIFLLGALFWTVIRFTVSDSGRRRLVCRLPILGRLLHWTALVRFSHLLAILIENEVPLAEALRLAGEGCADARIRVETQALAKNVEAGHGFASSLNLPDFPAHFLDVLRSDNNQQALTDALHSVGEMLEERLRAVSSFIVVICEPLIVILIGIAVGSIVIAMFMPLVRLLNDLS